MKRWVIYIILALLLFGLPFIAYAAEEYVGAKMQAVPYEFSED